MLDFKGAPVVDNHCHPMSLGKTHLEPVTLARELYHGIGDLASDSSRPKTWDASDELKQHFPYMGVVQTMVAQLARVLDCEPTLEAVATERNRRTGESFADYARLLYNDAGIVATVVDRPGPDDDPGMQLFPGTVLKMFQMDETIENLLLECDSFKDLKQRYQDALDRSVKVDGYIGVKSHLAERYGFGTEPATDADAETAFAGAKSGDHASRSKVYMAMFIATMQQCQELGIPVHVHSGFTGGIWEGPIANADPYLLVPLLQRPDLVQTKLVLLHGAYPWIQRAAALAHGFPHVWVDMGWTTPWISLRIAECYRDVIGMAPLSKILVGSGGHGTPEIAWLSALTAKIALGEVLSDAVRMELMTQQQAEKAGHMILHDNAVSMYGAETIKGTVRV